MRITYLIIIISSLLCFSCTTQKSTKNTNQVNKLTFTPNDEGEYDIIVFDPQYDTFLKTIALPKSFYSESFYKSKNRIYVTIWNQRYYNPLSYNPTIYEVAIELDPDINYGLDFEYKLYNFFKFMEWKNKIRFI